MQPEDDDDDDDEDNNFWVGQHCAWSIRGWWNKGEEVLNHVLGTSTTFAMF